MTTPHLIMWAVVIAVLILLSWKNSTALALAVSWMVAEFGWLGDGNNLPLSTYFKVDIAVIAFIYAKTIYRAGAKTYSSTRYQLRCMFTDLTVCDRWILAIFLLGAWPAYVLDMHPYYRWWILYWLKLAQFLLAGGEALTSYLAARREENEATPIIDRHMVVIPFPARVADAVRIDPAYREIYSSRRLRGHG